MLAWLKRLYARLPVVRELLAVRELLEHLPAARDDLRQQSARVNEQLAALSHLAHLYDIREGVAQTVDWTRVTAHWSRIGAWGQQHRLAADLLTHPRYADPRRLARSEFQVFSQNGEDGALAEIFRRVGTTDRFFAELGVGDGLENNTAFLLSRGWRGVWLEGDPQHCAAIRKNLQPLLTSGRLALDEVFVTRENAADRLRAAGVPTEFDLLSLDVDRNTYWVWDGLRAFRPRVVVVEYNASWPPGADWVMPYDPAGVWDQSFAYGASLTALERLGRELGYCLVGCDTHGINAYFVRADLVGDYFLPPFDAATHYEPPRHYLTRLQGHAAGYGALTGG